jgi:hypothetical protein
LLFWDIANVSEGDKAAIRSDTCDIIIAFLLIAKQGAKVMKKKKKIKEIRNAFLF